MWRYFFWVKAISRESCSWHFSLNWPLGPAVQLKGYGIHDSFCFTTCTVTVALCTGSESDSLWWLIQGWNSRLMLMGRNTVIDTFGWCHGKLYSVFVELNKLENQNTSLTLPNRKCKYLKICERFLCLYFKVRCVIFLSIYWQKCDP